MTKLASLFLARPAAPARPVWPRSPIRFTLPLRCVAPLMSTASPLPLRYWVDFNDGESLRQAARGGEVIVNPIRLHESIAVTALIELHQRQIKAGAILARLSGSYGSSPIADLSPPRLWTANLPSRGHVVPIALKCDRASELFALRAAAAG